MIKGSGQQVRNFVYVEDLAEDALAVLGEQAENKVLTLAGQESLSISDLATTVQDIFGGNPEIRIEESSVRREEYSGDIEDWKTTWSILNWKPKVGIREGIRKYEEWLRDEVVA